MKLQLYLTEAKIKSKLSQGVYGKQRTIEGYKNYGKLFVHKRKGMGYTVTTYSTLTLDDMIEIGGEYWHSSLNDLHDNLNS